VLGHVVYGDNVAVSAAGFRRRGFLDQYLVLRVGARGYFIKSMAGGESTFARKETPALHQRVPRLTDAFPSLAAQAWRQICERSHFIHSVSEMLLISHRLTGEKYGVQGE
jgi:hypothetical protein